MYKDFTETTFWKNAMQIAEVVFKFTNDLPRKEDYGLTSQLRRASVSISANIAEAYGRSSSADKSKFYFLFFEKLKASAKFLILS